MKVNNINFVSTINNSPKNSIKYASPSFTSSYKEDEFVMQNNPKNKNLTLKDKILHFFGLDNQIETPQEEKSEEIDFIVSEIIKQSQNIKKLSKLYYSLAKSSLIIGQEQDFRPYCNFNEAKNHKLVFGQIDETTSQPKTITQIDMNDGMKTLMAHEFFDGLNGFKVQDNSNPNITDELTIINKNIISLKEFNRDTKTVQRFLFTTNGLYYYNAEVNYKNEIKQVYSVVNYDKNNYENNEFVQWNGESYDIYKLSYETGLWEKVETVSEYNLEE